MIEWGRGIFAGKMGAFLPFFSVGTLLLCLASFGDAQIQQAAEPTRSIDLWNPFGTTTTPPRPGGHVNPLLSF